MDTDVGTDDDVPPVVTIRGDKVALGPWQHGILPLLLQWYNDLAVGLLSGEPPRPMSAERVEVIYEQFSKDEQEDSAHFLIYDAAALRPIGWAALTDIDHVHRIVDYHITIGARDCWGKGYGTETTILVLDYAFNVLGLHNVMLDVLGYNERAIRAYRRAGFKEIGRRRASHRAGSRVYDDIFMDCLSTEFQSPFPPVLELP